MSIRFKKPVWTGSQEISGYDYNVIGTRRNELVLSLINSQIKVNPSGTPIEWLLVFKDRNTYYFRRSDQATQTTGDIVRCPK